MPSVAFLSRGGSGVKGDGQQFHIGKRGGGEHGRAGARIQVPPRTRVIWRHARPLAAFGWSRMMRLVCRYGRVVAAFGRARIYEGSSRNHARVGGADLHLHGSVRMAQTIRFILGRHEQ